MVYLTKCEKCCVIYKITIRDTCVSPTTTPPIHHTIYHNKSKKFQNPNLTYPHPHYLATLDPTTTPLYTPTSARSSIFINKNMRHHYQLSVNYMTKTLIYTAEDYTAAQAAARFQKQCDTHAAQGVRLSIMDCIACASIFLATGFALAIIG